MLCCWFRLIRVSEGEKGPFGLPSYILAFHWLLDDLLVEVLCGSNLVWEESSFGRSNPRAVVGGKTILGENLYIGLAKHSSDSIVGKVHPSHKRCYVAYNGRELYYLHYKILTSDRTQNTDVVIVYFLHFLLEKELDTTRNCPSGKPTDLCSLGRRADQTCTGTPEASRLAPSHLTSRLVIHRIKKTA
ncbi:hypothetical protein J437_LFUL000445 [Ladona fulva]|uniref:Uncharacterized protein n=1 Tax=Ladona fulva TaxID=123851 RepID=A0A8K0NZ54_LADFU|nr:hypothetical protein J437_LFUL000445 [Ladona fulva]